MSMENFTLFTIPRAFEGIHEIRQRNAIGSWQRLRPQPEILLFGDDPGVEEAAYEMDCIYLPRIGRSKHGPPLVDDAFMQAQRTATYDLLAYANADIVLLQDFVDAFQECIEAFPQFLMTGQRWDSPDFDGVALDFSNGWQDRLWARVKANGGYHSRRGEDYFAFRRGLYIRVPPFAIGRSAWDNWLLFDVTKRDLPTVDATSCVRAIHQGKGKRRHGNTAAYRRNQRIWHEWGGVRDAGYTTSTMWILRPTGFELRQRRATWKP
jgi:hypothetical protein